MKRPRRQSLVARTLTPGKCMHPETCNTRGGNRLAAMQHIRKQQHLGLNLPPDCAYCTASMASCATCRSPAFLCQLASTAALFKQWESLRKILQQQHDAQRVVLLPRLANQDSSRFPAAAGLNSLRGSITLFWMVSLRPTVTKVAHQDVTQMFSFDPADHLFL